MDRFKEIYSEIISEGFLKNLFNKDDEERDTLGTIKIKLTCLNKDNKKIFFCKRIDIVDGESEIEGSGGSIDDAIIDWVKQSKFGTDY